MTKGHIRLVLFLGVLLSFCFSPKAISQINTDRILLMGRNALYYEDYVLAIQRFNLVIDAKPWLSEPYFYRGLAKFYLEDYQGAEIDCSAAVDKNPYLQNHYVLRALCRVNQGRYTLAEEDYRKAITISPLDKLCWHNMVLCQMELKEYVKADSTLDVMIRNWPQESKHYSLKGQVALMRKDTLHAEAWLDRALDLNNFDGQAWSMKSMIQAHNKQYKEAEESLDKAIVQMPRVAGLYINRALARYNQNNLRGAMSDYDMALDISPNNYLGHFNRGLLRANVGDDNLAIEDFNFILKLEPDNEIVLYNRALLLDNIGDYKGAIRDISAVIDNYPEFWEGYVKRAAIRRKIGDVYGAERDEFKVLQARMAVATGTYKSAGKTRKRSERNIEDYDKLVEEDEIVQKNEYASTYRGRIQNQQTDLQIERLFVLTYSRTTSDVKSYVAYSEDVDALNAKKIFPHTLYLTDKEGAMSEKQSAELVALIAKQTEELEKNPSREDLFFSRAMNYYHVRDFENAVADLNAYLEQEKTDEVSSLMLRAQCRFAQLEVSKFTASASDLRLGYLMVLQDYNHAREKQPNSPYLHYNAGCLMVHLGDYSNAISAFTEALKLDERLPNAYYSRGVVYILNGETEKGLVDLSQAGELGLYSAYNLIKRYSKEKKTNN